MRYQTELIIIIYLQPAEPGLLLSLLKQPSVQDFLISSLLSGYIPRRGCLSCLSPEYRDGINDPV